jgi:hypothetical protein
MHTSGTNPSPFEGKEPDPTQGRAIVESAARPNAARSLTSVAPPIAAEALDPENRRTLRLLDAMFHWALSR